MNTKRITKWAIGGALAGVTLFGGAVGAADYPPNDATATTVAVGGVSGIVSPAAPAAPAAAPSAAVAGALPATGSSSDATLKLAGGAIVAGGGLLIAAKLRRRPVPAA